MSNFRLRVLALTAVAGMLFAISGRAPNTVVENALWLGSVLLMLIVGWGRGEFGKRTPKSESPSPAPPPPPTQET